MITSKIGKAVFRLRKDYTADDLCEALDVVAYNGSLWACLEETRTTPEQESLFWMHLLDGGTSRVINTTFPLTGGGALADDLTLGLDLGTAQEGDTLIFRKGKWTIAPPHVLCKKFYYERHPTLETGFEPAYGGIIQDASVKYPDAWEYLLSEAGQLLCLSEAEWLAMNTAVWHTNADGTKIGWDGIGGVPFYSLNTLTGDLRLPDIRGMYIEAAGFDALDVGGVHIDTIRRFEGGLGHISNNISSVSGPFYRGAPASGTTGNTANAPGTFFDPGLVVPVGNKTAPRAWGALPCVYLGAPK